MYFLYQITLLFRSPTKLMIVWQRGAHRRRYSKSFNFQPGIAKPYRGVMVWTEPEELDMICTLYKVYHSSYFILLLLVKIMCIKLLNIKILKITKSAELVLQITDTKHIDHVCMFIMDFSSHIHIHYYPYRIFSVISEIAFFVTVLKS